MKEICKFKKPQISDTFKVDDTRMFDVQPADLDKKHVQFVFDEIDNSYLSSFVSNQSSLIYSQSEVNQIPKIEVHPPEV